MSHFQFWVVIEDLLNKLRKLTPFLKANKIDKKTERQCLSTCRNVFFLCVWMFSVGC